MSDNAAKSPESLSSRFRHHPLVSLREELDDLLSRFQSRVDECRHPGGTTPVADISETDRGIEVNIDLPGVNPDEIDIHVTNNTLRVCGDWPEQHEERGRAFHRIERPRGQYSRPIRLPCAVIDEEVAAEYRDGVLTITLPKTNDAKNRRIKVRHP